MRTLILLLTALAPAAAGAETQTPPAAASADPWALLHRLVGSWRGTGAGEPGNSTVERRYERILAGTFLAVENTSTYLSQEKNPKGEVHQDRGIYSYDKVRQRLVFRQFHVEGFVNHYVAEVPTGDSMVFVSESIENIPPGWRARETLRLVAPDELVEVFELAPPGADFAVYSRNHLRRASP